MENLQWGRRDSEGRIELSQAGKVVASVTPMAGVPDEYVFVTPSGNWQLVAGKDALVAQPIDDASRPSFQATGDGPTFGRSKTITLEQGEFTAVATNESKSDWVVEVAGEKVGQFTGRAHGVRHVELDLYEENGQLTLDQAVFTALVARWALEAKLDLQTKILLWTLLAMIPFIIAVYLF